MLQLSNQMDIQYKIKNSTWKVLRQGELPRASNNIGGS
jgi:hypothetical protein